MICGLPRSPSWPRWGGAVSRRPAGAFGFDSSRVQQKCRKRLCYVKRDSDQKEICEKRQTQSHAVVMPRFRAAESGWPSDRPAALPPSRCDVYRRHGVRQGASPSPREDLARGHREIAYSRCTRCIALMDFRRRPRRVDALVTRPATRRQPRPGMEDSPFAHDGARHPRRHCCIVATDNGGQD